MIFGNTADTEISRGESRQTTGRNGGSDSRSNSRSNSRNNGRSNGRSNGRNNGRENRVLLDKMNGDHAKKKKRIVEKPVLLSEDSHLRVVVLVTATRDFSTAATIINEYLSDDEQMSSPQ